MCQWRRRAATERATYETLMRFRIPGIVLSVVSTVAERRCIETCAPGMIYVSERSADSICVTALLFLVMKSEYMLSHLGGSDSTSPVFCVACLYIAAIASASALRSGAWATCTS
jgi:hypothetical protein